MRAEPTHHWSEDDFDAIGVGRPRARASRARSRRKGVLRGVLGGVAGCALVVGLLTLYAPKPGRDADFGSGPGLLAPPELTAPPARWSALAIPALTAISRDPAMADLAMRHEAFAGRDGEGRDVVEIGRFEADATHLRVAVERGEEERGEAERAGEERSFFVALALEAARAGLAVARTLQEEPLSTARGRIALTRVWLEDGASRECLAFRDETGGAAARMSGWLCAGGVTRADVACALDAFDLVDEIASRSILAAPVGGHASECPNPGAAEEWRSADAPPPEAGAGGSPFPPRRPRTL